MNHLGLSDSVLASYVISPRNVATGNVNSNVIDMSGWMGIRFTIAVGVLGTNGTFDVAVAHSDNSLMANATLVTDANSNANAALAQVVNSNSLQIIDIYRPKRYIRLVAVGHTNGSLAAITADRYRVQGTLPPTQTTEQYVKIRAL